MHNPSLFILSNHVFTLIAIRQEVESGSNRGFVGLRILATAVTHVNKPLQFHSAEKFEPLFH